MMMFYMATRQHSGKHQKCDVSVKSTIKDRRKSSGLKGFGDFIGASRRT